MQHDPYFSLAHPVTPLRDCPPRIQRMFGYTPKQPAVTRDGRLTCSCADPGGCTCRPTRDASPAPAKPTISNAAALTIVMALRHLDSRLAPLEARYGLAGAASGGSDLDARLAEAEQKRVAMAKEVRINKIEKLVEQHERDKEPSDNLEPAKSEDQPGAWRARADRIIGQDRPAVGRSDREGNPHVQAA